MSPTLGVGKVTALLCDVRDFNDILQEKELHKFFYFIKHHLRKEDIDADSQHDIQLPEVHWNL